MRRPNAPSAAGVAAGLERAEPARRLEQPRGLELAARAGSARTGPSASQASARWQQLAVGERRARVARARGSRRRGRCVGELGERAREQQVAGRGRGVAARAVATTVGTPAAQRRGVEHVVVDERRAVDELDRGGRADQPLAVLARRPPRKHEQRAQALAAGGDRRARVLGRAARRGRPASSREPLLDARRAARARASPPARDDLGDRCPLTAMLSAFVPTWIAMIPPAVRTQRMSRSPARAIAAASPSGRGKRLHRARQVACRRRCSPATRPMSGTTRSNHTGRRSTAAAGCGVVISSTTTRPPGRTTRAISASPRSRSEKLRAPKPTVAASKWSSA